MTLTSGCPFLIDHNDECTNLCPIGGVFLSTKYFDGEARSCSETIKILPPSQKNTVICLIWLF